jgi:hypothetical protein
VDVDIEQMGLVHHALLFGWLAQETVQRYGDNGRAVIREGVRRYGEERGRRMAERARSIGRPLDLISYLVFGEIDTSGNTWKIARKQPFLEVHALKCAWHEVWQQNDMLDVGGLYCLEVDDAIMHGFNPDFEFEVDATLSNDAPFCRFLYYGGKINLFSQMRLAWEKRRAVVTYRRPFAFHVLHVYRTMSQTLRETFGRDGQEISTICAQRFQRYSGVSLAEIETRWGGLL